MEFDIDECACMATGPEITCIDEPYLVCYFPFDNDIHDHSCNNIVGKMEGGLNILLSIHVKIIIRGRILLQVTVYRRLLIGRDDHLDQSEA